MAAYIVRRLIWVIFLLFVVTLITFIVFTVLPAADPAVLRAGRQPSPELVASIREQFGLSDPKIVQFFRYIGDILPFVGGDGVNFGYSFQSNQAVLPQILDRMPATIFLTGGAVVLWLRDRHPDRHDLRDQDRLVARPRDAWASRSSSSPRPVYFFGLVALFLFDDSIGRFPLLPGSGAYQDATNIVGKARGADHAVVRARGGVRGDLRALPARQPDRHACRRTTSARRAPRACRSGG